MENIGYNYFNHKVVQFSDISGPCIKPDGMALLRRGFLIFNKPMYSETSPEECASLTRASLQGPDVNEYKQGRTGTREAKKTIECVR